MDEEYSPQDLAAIEYFARLRQILTARELKTMLRTYKQMERDPDAETSRPFRAVLTKAHDDPQALELYNAFLAARERHGSTLSVSWEELIWGKDEDK